MVSQQAGGMVAVANPQLGPGAVAIGVHRGLGHAELARDLLGAEMPVHQAQALPLPPRQKFHLSRHAVHSHRSELLHAKVWSASTALWCPYSDRRRSLRG
jgi:hypothetical protein